MSPARRGLSACVSHTQLLQVWHSGCSQGQDSPLACGLWVPPSPRACPWRLQAVAKGGGGRAKAKASKQPLSLEVLLHDLVVLTFLVRTRGWHCLWSTRG